MTIDTLIFDMDDVLVEYDLRTRLKVLSEISGRAGDEIHQDIWLSGFEDLADAGGFSTADEYLEQFGERLGYAISRDEWARARKQSMTPYSDMLKLVETLKADHHIAILTNNVPLLREMLPAIAPQICALFGDQIYFSCDFQTAKPDPNLYRMIADKCGAKAANCLFTDDKRENVDGARSAGMFGIHFSGSREFRTQLADAGVKF